MSDRHDSPGSGRREGILITSQVLDSQTVKGLLQMVDGVHSRLRTEIEAKGVDEVLAALPPGQTYLPRVSSMSADLVLDRAQLKSILEALRESELVHSVRRMLGEKVVCNRDQTWVRRQYPLQTAPEDHTPHGWHQDGALGFDFLSLGEGVPSSDALLPTVTCWVALTACGVDAPGLEFVAEEVDSLVRVPDLQDELIRRRYGKEAFLRPALQPGDTVVFPGNTLHRTFVTDEMTRERTSLEFRFFSADSIPDRVKGDRYLEFL